MLTGWSQVKIQDYSQQPFNVFLPQPPPNNGTLSSYLPTSLPSQTDIAFNRGISSPTKNTGILLSQHHQKMLLIDQQKQATSFMPAGSKGNRFMMNMMLKKNKKSKGTTGNSTRGGKRAAQSASGKQQKNQVDDRLIPKAVVEGGRLRVELNGASILDERDRNEFDEYLGIGDIPLEAKLDERELQEQAPPQMPVVDTNNLRKLQDEQRDIEAKLKFIDGLINQQQNPQPKYFGGGILKKHTTEDFVVNLEQYQRAMEDIRKTMEELHGSKPHNMRNAQIFSIQEANSQSSLNNMQTTTLKSLQDYNTPQNQNLTAKKYYAQYEDMIQQPQQQQILNQRQVLSVIPTIPNASDEVDKVSMSSHYTNDARLYDATLMRQSIDSAQLRHSIKSASFASGNKLDFISNNIDSPKKDDYLPKPKKGMKQPQIITVIGKSNSSASNATGTLVRQSDIMSERLLAGVHAPVIEDTREETTIEHDRDDSDIMVGEPLVGNQHIVINDNQLAMTKVDLVFDQDMDHKSIYESKMYRARTQVTNPNFKQKAKPGKTPATQDQSADQISSQALLPHQDIGSLPAPQTKALNRDSNPFKSPIKVPREQLTITNQVSKETDTSSIDRVPSQTQQYTDEQSVLENPLPMLPGDTPLIKPAGQGPAFFGAPIPPLLQENSKQIDDKRLTELGKRAVQLNRQSKSRLEVLDNSVIYQQDGDLSKGVLYFKNLDSLKSFLLNKKRPIYSRKGNKVFQTEDAVTGLKLTRTESEQDDEKSRTIKADIQKKRQYLHQTLTNLMPQIQLRSMQQRTQQKANFQQTIDYVQKKVMGQTHSIPPNANITNGFSIVGGGKGKSQISLSTAIGRPREMTWAPMTNIQQYPFEDMMNPDGIIDLRILGSITPAGVVIPNGSHLRTFSRQQQDSMVNGRSESSPGMSRNGMRNLSQMSKRLQTFYGLQPATYESAAPNSKAGFRGSKVLQASNKKMNHHESEQSIGSDSNDTNSSRQTAGQRQVVFFKTSTSNFKQFENGGGTFMMQYPTLRPRLNEESQQKPGNHTVAMQQQQFMKGQQESHFSRTHNGFATSQSAGVPIVGVRVQQETSMLRMSRGIERNKIRQTSIPGVKNQVEDEVKEGSAESPSGQERARKHVIFSSYEGKSQKHPQTSPAPYSLGQEGGRQIYSTKNGAAHPQFEELLAEKKLNLPPTRNTVGMRVPPIYPTRAANNANNMASFSSRPDSKKSETRAMIAGSFFGSHADYNESQTQQRPSKEESGSMPPLRGSIKTTTNSNNKGKRVSNDGKTPPQINNYEQSPNGKRPSQKKLSLENNTKSPNGNMSSLKGLAQYTSPSGPNQHGSSSQFNMDISHNMNQKSNKSYSKMDQTIAQNKFSVQK